MMFGINPSQVEEYLGSDQPRKAVEFLEHAWTNARQSKYDGRKVGCVLVRKNRVISHGCNGYPRGADDDAINKLDREDRLALTIHAEENALLLLAELGISVEGADAYVTHHPCYSCAAKLSQAGIRNIYYDDEIPGWTDKSYLYKHIPNINIRKIRK